MHEYRRFIQRELDNRGWRQKDLVQKSGLSRQLVSNILRDDRDHLGQMPDATTMEALATGLGVSVETVRTAAARSLVDYTDDGSALTITLGDVSTDALLTEIRKRIDHAQPQPTSAPAATEPRAPSEASEDQEVVSRLEVADAAIINELAATMRILFEAVEDAHAIDATRAAVIATQVREAIPALNQLADANEQLSQPGSIDKVLALRADLNAWIDKFDVEFPGVDSSPGVACIGDSGDSSANPSTDHWSGGQSVDELAKRRPPPADLDDTPPPIEFADAARNEPGHVKTGDRVQHLDEEGHDG